MAHKVLVIEDSYDLLFLYQTAFAQFGYEVLQAESADKAVEILKGEFIPNVVVLDIEMPGALGTQVIDFIHSQSRLSDTKVIVVSANDLYKDRIRNMIHEYYVKPVGITTLINRADELLDVKRE